MPVVSRQAAQIHPNGGWALTLISSRLQKRGYIMRTFFTNSAGWLRLVVFATSLTTVTGCGSIFLLDANREIYDDRSGGKPGKNDISEPKNKDDWFLVEMSNRYGLMSLFALTAYRYDIDRKDRDRIGCDYLNPSFVGDRHFGMPRSTAAAGRWERWLPEKTKAGDPSPCFNESGLFYETYVHRSAEEKITEAVIAFRGSETRAGQTASDWGTNLSNFFGFEPQQYAIARLHIEKLTDRILAEAAGVPIYAVGHSLGGGLAQQAGYLTKSIKEVYAFDTSPVTNWTHLRRDGAVKQGYPIIHRVHNSGEGLAGFRGVATAATQARFGRHDVAVQFGPKALVDGHAITMLACNFALIMKETNSQGGMYDYPTSYIVDHVLKRDGGPKKDDVRVCDDENKGQD
ncbi:hypothetical protein RS694_03920 [Rhodoferax saidenbachensis]|uniref:Fungal lipase-like domain-containing protein n=2 Tax=Rhodoferax saidenbachensis TaxID=1484693 RepID=A0A1P8K748_9BURK|nr:hypothetical protein RS694_03920 [Rhodoferax saidenbachensis]